VLLVIITICTNTITLLLQSSNVNQQALKLMARAFQECPLSGILLSENNLSSSKTELIIKKAVTYNINGNLKWSLVANAQLVVSLNYKSFFFSCFSLFRAFSRGHDFLIPLNLCFDQSGDGMTGAVVPKSSLST
jgi:hypothetical protein